MPSQIKIQKVEDIKRVIQGAKALYLVDLTGLNVSELCKIRQKVKSKNSLLRVAQNNLAKIALKSTPFEELSSMLNGPNAFIIAYDDIAEPIKEFYQSVKELNRGRIRAGFYEKLLLEQEIVEIANLPDLKTLRGKLISLLNSPFHLLCLSMKGLLLKLVYALSEIKSKKEKNFKKEDL